MAQMKEGCKAGDMDQCYALGEKLLEHQDAAKSFQTFRQMCNQGDGRGCYMQGMMQLDGLGTIRNNEGGVAKLKLACEKGIQVACDEMRK